MIKRNPHYGNTFYKDDSFFDDDDMTYREKLDARAEEIVYQKITLPKMRLASELRYKKTVIEDKLSAISTRREEIKRRERYIIDTSQLQHIPTLLADIEVIKKELAHHEQLLSDQRDMMIKMYNGSIIDKNVIKMKIDKYKNILGQKQQDLIAFDMAGKQIKRKMIDFEVEYKSLRDEVNATIEDADDFPESDELSKTVATMKNTLEKTVEEVTLLTSNYTRIINFMSSSKEVMEELENLNNAISKEDDMNAQNITEEHIEKAIEKANILEEDIKIVTREIASIDNQINNVKYIDIPTITISVKASQVLLENELKDIKLNNTPSVFVSYLKNEWDRFTTRYPSKLTQGRILKKAMQELDLYTPYITKKSKNSFAQTGPLFLYNALTQEQKGKVLTHIMIKKQKPTDTQHIEQKVVELIKNNKEKTAEEIIEINDILEYEQKDNPFNIKDTMDRKENNLKQMETGNIGEDEKRLKTLLETYHEMVQSESLRSDEFVKMIRYLGLHTSFQEWRKTHPYKKYTLDQFDILPISDKIRVLEMLTAPQKQGNGFYGDGKKKKQNKPKKHKTTIYTPKKLTPKQINEIVKILAKKHTGGDLAQAVESLSVKKAPASVRQYLEQKGDLEVSDIYLYRQPVQQFAMTAINLLSLGQFDVNKQFKNIDTMFHVWMTCQLSDGSICVLEKNAVVNIEDYDDSRDFRDRIALPNPLAPKTIDEFKQQSRQYRNIKDGKKAYADKVKSFVPKVSLREFLTRGLDTLKSKGLDPWAYNGQNNNCQVFLISLLEGNGINTQQARDFLVQDTEYIVGNLNPITKMIAQGAVNVAQFWDVLLHGARLRRK